MKVTALTIHYSEARSARYQKVEHSVSLTVELSEGENVRDAIARYRPALVETVADATFDNLVRVLEEDENMQQDGGAGGRRRHLK